MPATNRRAEWRRGQTVNANSHSRCSHTPSHKHTLFSPHSVLAAIRFWESNFYHIFTICCGDYCASFTQIRKSHLLFWKSNFSIFGKIRSWCTNLLSHLIVHFFVHVKFTQFVCMRSLLCQFWPDPWFGNIVVTHVTLLLVNHLDVWEISPKICIFWLSVKWVVSIFWISFMLLR